MDFFDDIDGESAEKVNVKPFHAIDKENEELYRMV